MQRTSGWLVFVAVMILALAGTRAEAGLSVGDQPKFAIQLMNGQTVTHKHIKHRITVIEFWATWCGPCVKQVPHLRKLYKKYNQDGFAMISVSQDRTERKARKFIENNGMVWAQAFGGNQGMNLSKQWGVKGIPHAFMFGPTGKLIWQGHPGGMEGKLKSSLKKYSNQLGKNAGQDTASDKGGDSQEAAPGGQKAGGDSAGPKNAKEQPGASARPGRSAQQGQAWRAAARKLNRASGHLHGREPEMGKALATVGEIDADALVDPKLHHFAKRFQRRLAAANKSHPDALKQAKASEPEGAKRLATMREALASGDYQKPMPRDVRQARLEKAKKLKAAGHDVKAYAAFKRLAERAKGTAAGQTASQQLAAYKADQAFQDKLTKKQHQSKAKRLLRLGNNYAQADRDELAASHYRKVLDQYPQTDAADQAKTALSRLD